MVVGQSSVESHDPTVKSLHILFPLKIPSRGIEHHCREHQRLKQMYLADKWKGSVGKNSAAILGHGGMPNSNTTGQLLVEVSIDLYP